MEARLYGADEKEQSQPQRWEGERKGEPQCQPGGQLQAGRGQHLLAGVTCRVTPTWQRAGTLSGTARLALCPHAHSILTCAAPSLRVLLFNK